MPRGDGTGPEGRGPMTGWSVGFCSDASMPGPFIRPMDDNGYGYGRGRRHRAHRGWTWFGNQFNLPASGFNRQQEQMMLKDQAGYHESVLSRIKKRVADLEGEKETE